MKLRILNYGVTATHGFISNLGSIREPHSVSDFHALVYDPDSFRADSNYSTADLQRRQAEVRDLILRKGGIVIYLLRPDANLTAYGCWTLCHQALRHSYERY